MKFSTLVEEVILVINMKKKIKGSPRKLPRYDGPIKGQPRNFKVNR